MSRHPRADLEIDFAERPDLGTCVCTAIRLNGAEVAGITSAVLEIGPHGPLLTLTLYPSEISIEGPVDVHMEMLKWQPDFNEDEEELFDA